MPCYITRPSLWNRYALVWTFQVAPCMLSLSGLCRPDGSWHAKYGMNDGVSRVYGGPDNPLALTVLGPGHVQSVDVADTT